MNAVNPVPAAAAEPSMEEILASIRRIIADDQSMPGHAGPPRDEPPGPTSGELPAPSSTAEAGAVPLDAPGDLPPEHGVVAAPQFVSPEGPTSVMDTPHPLAPQPPEVAGTGSVDADDLQGPVPDGADLHEAALRDMHEEPALHVHELAPEEPPAMTIAHDLAADRTADHPAVDSHAVPGEAPSGLFSAATSQSLAAAFNTLAVSRLADDSAELRALARGMLEPLLKSWLDENLPSMVEAIIRDEIDRMSRRGR